MRLVKRKLKRRDEPTRALVEVRSCLHDRYLVLESMLLGVHKSAGQRRWLLERWPSSCVMCTLPSHVRQEVYSLAWRIEPHVLVKITNVTRSNRKQQQRKQQH